MIRYSLYKVRKRYGYMQIIKKHIFPLLLMSIVSLLMLLGVSSLTYLYKWQADKALLGITITYIIAGFAGGRGQNWLSETSDISKKLIEGICLSVVFMTILLLVSVFVINNEWNFSSRFFMIGMLITGSVCLGRIL